MLLDKESDRSQLQAINGIGPKIEKWLKREGVFTLSQLASIIRLGAAKKSRLRPPSPSK